MSDRSGRAAFRYPSFRYFLSARGLVNTATEMQAVAVAWQVYGITHRPLDLGLVGLAQFLPAVLLFLVSGHAADRFSRQRILQWCCAGYTLCSLLLLGLTFRQLSSVAPIYAVLLFNGVVRAFNGPAGQAFLPLLVPSEDFPNAVAWNASAAQACMVLGPLVGGLIYGWRASAAPVYACAAAGYAAALVLLAGIRIPSAQVKRVSASYTVALEGLRYIWRNRLILGAISLDLFAVLLGGAVALLPVYARDILKTGASGLGVLRGAPGVGAVIMALTLARWPLRRHAGAIMLWCVCGFGVFTISFGLSRNLALSLVSLILMGACDMVSVVVRHTLVQIATPDEMRGRVSAVNVIFIGASNELGQFESGITAQWFGTVPAVVLGGLGTMAIVALWAWRFPALRRVNELAAPPEPQPAGPEFRRPQSS